MQSGLGGENEEAERVISSSSLCRAQVAVGGGSRIRSFDEPQKPRQPAKDDARDFENTQSIHRASVRSDILPFPGSKLIQGQRISQKDVKKVRRHTIHGSGHDSKNVTSKFHMHKSPFTIAGTVDFHSHLSHLTSLGDEVLVAYNKATKKFIGLNKKGNIFTDFSENNGCNGLIYTTDKRIAYTSNSKLKFIKLRQNEIRPSKRSPIRLQGTGYGVGYSEYHDGTTAVTIDVEDDVPSSLRILDRNYLIRHHFVSPVGDRFNIGRHLEFSNYEDVLFVAGKSRRRIAMICLSKSSGDKPEILRYIMPEFPPHTFCVIGNHFLLSDSNEERTVLLLPNKHNQHCVVQTEVSCIGMCHCAKTKRIFLLVDSEDESKRSAIIIIYKYVKEPEHFMYSEEL